MSGYGFDFILPWDWAALEAHAAQAGGLEDLAELKELLSLEDARFLLEQLSRLSNPAEIQKLRSYQHLQEEWGAGFYGMLPEQLTEEIPLPEDFPSLLKTALLLARVRARNREALKEVNPNYPLEFKGQPFPSLTATTCPPDWELGLDLSAIRGVLALFRKERVSLEEAKAVAALPAFRQMIRHRRDLGYLPEPLITEEGLARLLERAARRAPLEMLWKWLSPQNFFDLADVFLQREEYEALVETLQGHAEEIAGHILATIARYATDEMRKEPFRDRVSFTAGWGIAGWATQATAGINLEHYKDDYERLLATLTHETFHRFQLQVCPAEPTVIERARSFEDLTRFPFPDERDRKFYEVLSYIFLEGTATFVAPSHPPEDLEASRERGIELLRECFASIYEQGNLERADELVNEGLRSNGPFYWLGAYMAERIVQEYGPEALGRSLKEGGPGFFREYLSTQPPEELRWGPEIEVKVAGLVPGAS